MSNLGLTFSQIYSRVLSYLGLSPDKGEEVMLAKGYSNDGYSMALAAIDPRTKLGYQWSFLQPEATIDLYADKSMVPKTAAADGTVGTSVSTFLPTMEGAQVVGGTAEHTYILASYVSGSTAVLNAALQVGDTGVTCTISANGLFALPADFGSLIDDPAFSPNDAGVRLVPRSVAYLRGLYAGAGRSPSTPKSYAVVPRAFDSAVGQRSALLIWPEPSRDYTMYYRYQVDATALDGDDDLPIGGPQFAQVVLQAALAVAEQRENNRIAEQTALYERMLAAAIDADARNKARNLGLLADGSEGTGNQYRFTGLVTYE